MKKALTLILYFLLLLVPKGGYTQHAELEKSVTNLFKLNFLMPGVSFEQKVMMEKTVHMAGYIDIELNPSISFAFRNYYNLSIRGLRGKRTEMNSGNYLAPIYIGKYSHMNDYFRTIWINQVGGVWGMQRSSPSGFSFDLNVGLAYLFASQNSGFSRTVEPILHIALGFKLGK